MKTGKRALAAFLAIVLICGMLPISAMAAEPQLPAKLHSVEIPAQVNPLYAHIYDVDDLALPESVSGDASTLAEATYVSEAEAVAQIREHMKARTGSFEIYVQSENSDPSGLFSSLLTQAMEHTGEPTEGDFLRWQYAGRGGEVSYAQSGSTYNYALTYNVTYYTTAEQEAQMDEAVAALLAELDLTGKSDYDKLCAVYDYICANITYDHDNLEDTTYKLKHTAYAALINKTAVCQGYAVLLYRLMLELGVDIRVIVGIGNDGNHAWNIVQLDDLYYNADPTWDAIWHQAGLEYDFFLRNEVNFTENGTDHIRNDEYNTEAFWAAYPMGETDYEPKAATVLAEGTCGEALTWVLTDDGTLTISGKGEMDTYAYQDTPWNSYWENIRTVVIGNGVTNISEYAFISCEKLSAVVISETVTTIGSGAFMGCTCLTEIYIPASVENIADGAFRRCDGLLSFEVDENNPSYSSDESGVLYNKEKTGLIQAPSGISGDYQVPAGVEWIDSYAFYYCTGLTGITIPESTLSMPANAFSNCTALTGIWVDADNAAYCSDEYGVVYNKAKTELLRAPGALGGSYVIPDGVVTIGSSAFEWCTQLTGVTIPEGTETISWSAFNCCTGLAEVTIPDGVTHVGATAFNRCTSLEEIVLPDSVTTLEMAAFQMCTSLKKVVLSANLAAIGNSVFSQCTSLTEITIPERVTSIDNYAFLYCTALTGITFRGDAPAIADYAFYGVTATAYYPADNANWTADVMQNYGGTITWVSYGEPVVEKIASGWSGATTWVLTSDGMLTFSGEGNMKNYGWNIERPWEAYADQITSVVIEEGVTAVGSGAFKDMTALESVTLPASGLSKIGIAAFYGCTSLEEIYIPDGVYTIWEYTFKNCTGLKSVRLPKTLVKIDQGAFEACTALTELFLPTNVEIIGGWSFKGCTAMKRADMQWADATEIRPGAFKNCTTLTEIILPANIEKLGDSCFYGIGAENFTVPATVTAIMDWCFARSALKEITFLGDAPAIGIGAFNKITLTAYYPGNNATWTADILQNYGGTVVWTEK